MMHADLVAQFGDSALVTEAARARYQRDRSEDPNAVVPAAVVLAASTGDVQAAVKIAAAHDLPIVVWGAGSSLSGGSSSTVPSLVISLEKMTTIEIDTAANIATVGPGVINAALKRAAAAHGLWYPPDPSSMEFCSLGGNVATNAGGLCCIKYGVTREYVLGLTVVLADGEVITVGGRSIKDVAGLPLLDLFIGSEGTLGIVTELELRLLPAQARPTTLVAFFPDLADAVRAVMAIRSSSVPSMMELMDRDTINAVEDATKMGLDRTSEALLVIQSEATTADAPDSVQRLQGLCTDNGASECYFTDDPEEAEMFIEARRQAIPAVEKKGPLLLEDVGVPVPQLLDLVVGIKEIARAADITVAVIAHAGDGNTHPLLVTDPTDPAQQARAQVAYGQIMDLAIRLGGTITGEHGVGRLKQQWLVDQVGDRAYQLGRAIKAVFDPDNRLNPGVIFSR